MSRPRKLTVTLTERELAEIANCLAGALREGIAYGMVTRSEQAILEHNRKRLLAKIERIKGSP